MTTIIFCAGLGTRLKPITNYIPKALVKINNYTLLELAIIYFLKFNIKNFIINVHHFADLIVSEIKNIENKYNINIKVSNEKDKLLETGGALKKILLSSITTPPYVITFNVDILTNFNLINAINYFLTITDKKKFGGLLITKERKTHRYLLFNEKKTLCGWVNYNNNEKKIKRFDYQNLSALAFSGITILDKQTLIKIKSYPKDIFSLTEFFIETCNELDFISYSGPINYFWMDIGKIKDYKIAQKINLKEINLL